MDSTMSPLSLSGSLLLMRRASRPYGAGLWRGAGEVHRRLGSLRYTWHHAICWPIKATVFALAQVSGKFYRNCVY